MISNIQTQPKLPLHGLDIGGLNDNNPTAVKTSTIAKAIIGTIAVAATVGFTFLALATANPLFLIGTAVAVGVLMSLTGVQLHSKVGYRYNRYVDPTFYQPYPPIVPAVPAYRGPPVQPLRNNFNPMRDHGIPVRAAAVPARGNTPVIPVRDAGAVHAPVKARR